MTTTVGELKEFLNNYDDNMDVVIGGEWGEQDVNFDHNEIPILDPIERSYKVYIGFYETKPNY